MIQAIGVDIVEIRRIRRAVQRWGDRFLNKILTPHEYDYCLHPRLKVHSIAARFAAKEALFKSLPPELQPIVGWHDLEVVNDASGKPRFRGLGRMSRLFTDHNVQLSISHSLDSAVAVVVFEEKGENL
jgi:holo-[acyl-carrier protein] synthase